MEAGEILLKRGLLDERQLALVRSRQVEGTRIDQTAVEMGLVSEEAVLRAVGVPSSVLQRARRPNVEAHEVGTR